jgi:N-succinyldiaminopimelate aminotransferase
VVIAGGVPRYVLLRPPDEGHARWWFHPAELEAAFSARTRLVVLNTPHNPTGKVFTREELEQIAQLCQRHGAVVLADEVYEHIVYPPARHIRMATLPGMEERTLTVSSGGKSFSLTGWKIGWAIGSPKLRHAVQQAHQFATFATAAPLQEAIAAALRMPDAYFAELEEGYRRRRDEMIQALAGAGLPAPVPEATYYAMADIRGTGFEDDYAFCRHLTKESGVAAIPPSAFYSEGHRAQGQGMARFAFCKREATLREAAARLRKLGGGPAGE